MSSHRYNTRGNPLIFHQEGQSDTDHIPDGVVSDSSHEHNTDRTDDEHLDDSDPEITFRPNMAEVENLKETVQALEKDLKALQDSQDSQDSSKLATPKLDLFQGLASEDAQTWWNRFERLSNFHKWSAQKRGDAFLLYMRGPAETWAKTLDSAILHDDAQDSTKLKDAFVKKFSHKATTFLLETKFHERKMAPSESVEHFVRDLQDIGQKLDKSDAEIQSQFLRGLTPRLKTLVLVQSPETLTDATQLAMVAETVNKEQQQAEKVSVESAMALLTDKMSSLTSKLDTVQKDATRSRPFFQPPQVNAIQPLMPPWTPRQQIPYTAAAVDSTQTRRPPFRPSQNTTRQAGLNNLRCWRCGTLGHTQRFCQASTSFQPRPGIMCYMCQRFGHISRNCPLNNGTRGPNF